MLVRTALKLVQTTWKGVDSAIIVAANLHTFTTRYIHVCPFFNNIVTSKSACAWAALMFHLTWKTFSSLLCLFLFLSEEIREYSAYNEEPEIGDLMEWIASEVCLLLRILPVIVYFEKCNCYSTSLDDYTVLY